MPAEAGEDAVGVRLAQLLGPRAVADVELARRVTLDASGRQLLQLDPDDPGAVRGTRWVDRERLAAHDRRLRGEESALGLVHRARDAVEARREVNDRRAGEPVVAVPVSRLGHRDVDLHRATAVAIALGRARDLRRNVSVPSSSP